MTKQTGLSEDKAFHGKRPARHDSSPETGFNRLFKRFYNSRDITEILTVHGDTAFHTKLSAATPKSATITRIQQQGLRNFRGRQRFTMLFYSYPQDTDNNAGSSLSQLLEDLCYCRMLLRPGAFLFMPVHDKRQAVATDWFRKQKRREDSWLRQAGFVNLDPQKMGAGCTLACGMRPTRNF